MTGFATRAIHGPRTGREALGAIRPPLYDSVAFEFDSAQELEAAFSGRKPAHTYSRITNPTVEELEQRIKFLSDGFGVIAVSSGMAAIADTVLALAEPGTNIVTSEHLFSHTLSLLKKTLGRWGLQTRFADMTDAASVAGCIDANTRLVFLETITNPQLEVADIAAVVKTAGQRNVPVVIDGTLTTPFLFSSKKAGVAVEILSSTKYISGGATAVGGLIIDNGTFDWNKTPSLAETSRAFGPGALLAKLRKEVYRNIGTCLAPHNAWLQILGLETMPLRIRASCDNASALARFLESRSEVVSVNYPGLETSPFHAVASRQFEGGFGGIISFDLGDKVSAFKFIDRLQLIRKATNIHDNKSLIIHPASTIFSDFSIAERSKIGVTEGMVRFSAGIEDIDDLIDDITGGFESL